MHQHTKFRKDRSNSCGDIAIFVIFQMPPPSGIFKNTKFWTSFSPFTSGWGYRAARARSMAQVANKASATGDFVQPHHSFAHGPY